MRNLVISGLALLFIALRCGDDSLAEEVAARAMKSEMRQVASFTAIEASGSQEIRITCRESRRVEIRGAGDTVPWISTEVRNNTLVIAATKSIAGRRPVQVLVSAPDIEKITFSGSGEVHLVGVRNDRIELVLNGSGQIHAAGETRSLTAQLSGSGDLNLKGLHAGRARVTVSGSGSADVYAVEELDAAISGSGDVTYYGNPVVVHRRVSGSGAITGN